MLFESTGLFLRGIVNSLERDGDIPWDEHIESGRQCMFELHQMSRGSDRTYRADSNPKYKTVLPAPERASRAIPFVKLMNTAMRYRDRSAALESGKAAVAELSGTVISQPVV